MISIALPKGRLGEQAYGILERAGYGCPDVMNGGRRLLFESPDGQLAYFWVKAADAAIYVARGVADLSICGKDILLEQNPPVYELLDLRIGLCRMDVAAKQDFADDPAQSLRVATKFPNIARAYYEGLGRPIDVIELSGSVELAPLLNLSDVIVDIVESGATLRENGLHSIVSLFDISARLIANRAAYQFKQAEIRALVNRLKEGL